MADISKEHPDRPENSLHRWMELAVPLLSFGGALLGIVSWISEAPLDFRITIFGCVLASWVLAYLAWIRPKKDIVALSTPIYSFIFIAVPTDIFSSVILQLLYAVSLTILLVRLKYRFGKPGTAASMGKELGGSLKTYIGQTRDSFSDISPEAAHSAAVVFVRFAEGNYEDAAQNSKIALVDEEHPDPVTPLMRAFSIIREHATLLNTSLPRPVTYLTFPEKDLPLLANPPVPAYDDDDMKFYTALDNALLLLFSAAWNASEQDHPHLIACQAFAQKLISSK
jgi:hypothetical protein